MAIQSERPFLFDATTAVRWYGQCSFHCGPRRQRASDRIGEYRVAESLHRRAVTPSRSIVARAIADVTLRFVDFLRSPENHFVWETYCDSREMPWKLPRPVPGQISPAIASSSSAPCLEPPWCVSPVRRTDKTRAMSVRGLRRSPPRSHGWTTAGRSPATNKRVPRSAPGP